MSELKGTVILDAATLGVGAPSAPTFCVGIQETGVGLHSFVWPVGCDIIGMLTPTNSLVILSTNGQSSFSENVPTGAGGEIIAATNSFVWGLRFSVTAGQTLSLYNGSSQSVVIICERTGV